MLFPLSPVREETLLGFLIRNVEHNLLPGPSPILDELDVYLGLKSDCLGHLAGKLPLLAEIFGRPLQEISLLWGGEPLSGGRRRLGGVWLRPSMVSSSRRRLPATFAPGSADRAIWMVRNLGFCRDSWEFLVDRCPRPWCGHPLTWNSAKSLDRCGFCGASIGEAKRQIVPARERAALKWLTDLFSEDEEEVERSLQKIPPTFELENATDAYELINALVKPMRAICGSKQNGAKATTAQLSKACEFVLDFPRSYWDLEQLNEEVRRDFRHRIELVTKYTAQAVVQNELQRLLHYGRARSHSRYAPSKEPEWLSLGMAARRLSVQKTDVRSLIDRGFLQARNGGGGDIRRHSAILRSDVTDLNRRVRERLSWRQFCSESGLPQIALEQLLACGSLRAADDPVVAELFGDRQLERSSAESLLALCGTPLLEEGESDWLPLSRVMQGVGGREKPWARVIQAGLTGDLPGGFRRERKGRELVHFTVHPITASRLIMGGPSAVTPFNFQDGDFGVHWRPDLSPGETELHLNCTAQDIAWLRSRKLLVPINARGQPTRYARLNVEALGRQLVTSREIAARLGLKPVDVWQHLQGLASGGAFGQGFFSRELVEPLLHTRIDLQPNISEGAS